MDRQTRKDLKTDKFAQEVQHGFEFLTEHKDDVRRYGPIALAVIVLAAGIYFYRNYQAGVREDLLSQAVRIDRANVGQPSPGSLTFPTPQDKDKARTKAFSELATKYSGTQEGAIAQFQLASDSADKGDLATAEKLYKDIVDSAPKLYASLARMSLAKVYVAEGKQAEAEKVLRDAIAHPSAGLSKEQATIELAMIIAKTNPDEAKKMLTQLETSRTAISRAAVQAIGELQTQPTQK